MNKVKNLFKADEVVDIPQGEEIAEVKGEDEIASLLAAEANTLTKLEMNDFILKVELNPIKENLYLVTENHYKEYPRLWRVVINDVYLQNNVFDECDLFLEFNIGNNKTEYSVKSIKNKSDHIYTIGDINNILRTPVTYKISKSDFSNMNFFTKFETFLSLNELKCEKFECGVWHYEKYGLNSLVGQFSESLENVTNGTVSNEKKILKKTKKTKETSYVIKFSIMFEEIYNFEIEFRDFYVHGHISHNEIMSSNYKFKHIDITNYFYVYLTTHFEEGRRGAGQYDPSRKLQLNMKIITSTSNKMKITSSIHEGFSKTWWDKVGVVIFTGCYSDLISSILEINITDKVGNELIQTAAGSMSLLNILDNNFILCNLRSCLKTNRIQAGDEIGNVQGSLKIPYSPINRQSGHVLTLTNNYFYLFVNIQSIEHLATPDSRNEADSFVQVSFNGYYVVTDIVKSTTNPKYQATLILPIFLPNTEIITLYDLDRLGNVDIDVWLNNYNYNEHCGHISFTLRQIFFNKQKETTVVCRFYRNPLTGVEAKYNTHILNINDWLDAVFLETKTSQIELSAWTYQDIMVEHKFKYLEPYSLYPAEFIDNENYYINNLKMLPNGSSKPFFYKAYDQHKVQRYLMEFCESLRPPNKVTTPNAANYFVQSIPFISSFSIYDNLWFLPNYTLIKKTGSLIDHCLLLNSLFTGLNEMSFICYGRLKSGLNHFWLCTFHYNSEEDENHVKFWELTNDNVYVLKNRFLEKALVKQMHQRTVMQLKKNVIPNESENDEDKNINNSSERNNINLPYEALYFLFNNINIWYNLQNENPSEINFDLWNSDLFYGFTDVPSILRPCSITSFKSTKLYNTDEIRFELTNSIMTGINFYRTSKNLTTKWNKDANLEKYILNGLKYINYKKKCSFDEEALSEALVEEWKLSLYKKLPVNCRLRGVVYHAPHQDYKALTTEIVNSNKLLNERDISSTYCLVVFIEILPSDIVAALIYVLLITKMSESDNRKLIEYRNSVDEKKQKKKEKKQKHKQLMSFIEKDTAILGDTENDVNLLKANTMLERTTFESEIVESQVVESNFPQAAVVAEEVLSRKVMRENSRSVKFRDNFPEEQKISEENLIDEKKPEEKEKKEKKKKEKEKKEKKKKKKIKKKKIKIPDSCIKGIFQIHNEEAGILNNLEEFKNLTKKLEKVISDGLVYKKDYIKVYEVNTGNHQVSFLIENCNEELLEDLQDILQNDEESKNILGREVEVIYEKQEKVVKRPQAIENEDQMQEYLEYVELINTIIPEVVNEFKMFYLNKGYKEEDALYYAVYYASIYSQKFNEEKDAL